MALIANTWSKSTFDPAPYQDNFTEALGAVSVEVGYYKNPTRPDEEILIDRLKVILNRAGTEIRRDKEYWHVEVPGAPPLRYEHTIWADVYLPGLGYGLRKQQEETHYFWAFSPLAKGSNLGLTRVVNANVVYDIPLDPSKAVSDEAKKKLKDGGMAAGPNSDRIVATGKLWSDANASNAVVKDATTAQATKWVRGVIFEHDEVDEEFDKWTKWTVKKDALRSGGVEVTGPEYIKKESFTYKLPVPLGPPKIAVSGRAEGVQIEIKGGGAEIDNGYRGPSGRYHVAPEGYSVYRKIVSEPARTEDDNLYGLWETPPAAATTRMILTNTDVKDLDGNPASPLPAATSYTLPHDADPEPLPRDTEFRRIAEVDNTQGKTDIGKATFLDTDVEDTAEYEYYATAVYGTQESTDSNHETHTFSGSGGTRNYRIIDRKTAVDAIAPNDPLYPEEDFGELVEFDLPAAGQDVALVVAPEIADRQFAMNRAADANIRLTTPDPLLGAEWGQKISIPTTSWETFGNALHLSTETDNDVWMLIGFRRMVQRTKDGDWGTPTTLLTLQERPRPQ